MKLILTGDQNSSSSKVCVACAFAHVVSLDLLARVSQLQAQRYQALLDELQDKRLQLKLAELHQNEQAVGVLGDTLREKQQAAGEKNDELLSQEQAVKTCKKEHGRLNREQQHLEKEIRCVSSRVFS